MMNRRVKDSGIEPIFAYAILVIGFIGLSVYLFFKTEFAQYIYLFLALAITGKLSETRRTEFLRLCFGDSKFKKIRIIENLIIIFPFLLFLIYKKLFLSAIILLVLTTILALMNFRTTVNVIIPTPFSKRPFEFTTGFRNSFYVIFAAYALTIIAVSVDNFNLGIFALLLVFVTTLSYYTLPENAYYVWTYSLTPRQFLIKKIKTATLFSSLLALPVALMISIFFRQNMNVMLLFFLIGWAFLVCMIVSKYSSYPEEMNIAQGVLLVLCISFPPILIVIIPYLFLKSENHLSHLLK